MGLDALRNGVANKQYGQLNGGAVNPFAAAGTPGVGGPSQVGPVGKTEGAGGGANQFLPQGTTMKGASAWGAEGGSAAVFGGHGKAGSVFQGLG